MNESKEDILADMDATLDQLVENAKALKAAKSTHAFSHEVETLNAMQESLLARLMHRQSLLVMDKKKQTLDSIKKEAVEKKVVEYTQTGSKFGFGQEGASNFSSARKRRVHRHRVKSKRKT